MRRNSYKVNSCGNCNEGCSCLANDQEFEKILAVTINLLLLLYAQNRRLKIENHKQKAENKELSREIRRQKLENLDLSSRHDPYSNNGDAICNSLE